MNPTVVISQSMYFPWVGLLEQIRLADIFVHYDDVHFSRGSFYNRVQLKTDRGMQWLTVPLRDFKLGQKINEVRLDDTRDWRSNHMRAVENSLRGAPYLDDALVVMQNAFAVPATTLADVTRASVLALADYFELNQDCRFADSVNMAIPGRSSQRVLDVVKFVSGGIYVTGHGAKAYLDHKLFEQANIQVRYMEYRCIPYPQLHGSFTPFVTALDLVANCGRQGVEFICSNAVDWKEFIRESA